MKVMLRSLFVAAAAALAAQSAANSVQAQQPLPVVELAEPIAPQPPPELPPSPPPGLVPRQNPGPAPWTAPGLAAPIDATVTDAATPEQDAAEQIDVPARPLLPAAPDDAGGELPDGELPADQTSVEVVRERYPSGVIRIEREVTLDADGNYIPHGLWRQFDETGRLIAEGRFVESRKEGVWRRLYQDNDTPLLASEPYRNFTPPFISQATFQRGQLHGKWLITDAKQRKIHEIAFVEGERNGAATWYYPSGQVMLQAQYEQGRATGELAHFGVDSQLIAKEMYELGRKIAPRIEYYDERQQTKRFEATFLHAALAIRTPDDWDTATLAVFEPRGQDEKHGPFTAWHPNGQLARQGEFRYDLPVGTFIYWYPNGQKQMEGTYIDGRQEGGWTWWHENGLKAISGSYRDATAIGLWQWWEPTGKLAQKADLSERPIAGPPPEPDAEPGEAKVRMAEPVVEVR